MPKLVAPDGIIYVINDTGPDQADLAALVQRRPDLPAKNNLHQLFRWTPGPPGVAKQAIGSYWTKSSGPRKMASTFRSSEPPLMR